MALQMESVAVALSQMQLDLQAIVARAAAIKKERERRYACPLPYVLTRQQQCHRRCHRQCPQEHLPVLRHPQPNSPQMPHHRYRRSRRRKCHRRHLPVSHPKCRRKYHRTHHPKCRRQCLPEERPRSSAQASIISVSVPAPSELFSASAEKTVTDKTSLM